MLRLQAPLPERYAAATDDELATMIGEAKGTLGSRVFILGHHYQRDEVMRWADARGDSFGLSRIAAGNPDAEYIVFCGVHFMAESADVLTADHQKVLLPDLNAGCSMADMADLDEVEGAWEELGRVVDAQRLIPVTYMNSAAALKAFVAAQVPRYREIAAPTVIITGDRDGTVSPRINARAAAALIPNAKLVVLEGIGHMVTHAAAEAIAAEVEKIAANGE